jgi:DNA end-binding protein Ku
MSIGTITIKIGLVNIPLSVVSFLNYQNISFKQLCPDCLQPIQQKRVCKNCGKEIPFSELKSGFRISKNNIVVIDKEALKQLENLETKILGIIPLNSEYEFITEKCYLLAPHKDMPKTYFLLLNILLNDNIELVIEYALRKKLNLGIIKPIKLFGKNYLMLKQILYSDKIKEIPIFKEEQILEDELKIGRQLFKTICETLENKEYKDIKDKRVELLQKILEGKIEKKVEVEKGKNLIEQLTKSVELIKKEMGDKGEKEKVEEKVKKKVEEKS